MQEEDKSIFLEAMQDVIPLAPNSKKQNIDSLKQKPSHAELLKKVRKKHKYPKKYKPSETKLDLSKSLAKVTAFETLLYCQKGMRPQEMSKLKKGEFILQNSLDLHGLTMHQAEIEIIDFLHHAYQDKLRFIRIIHGKGYNSNEEFPALKNLVNLILRQTQSVVGFASTPEKDGGTGAVNIMLKAQ